MWARAISPTRLSCRLQMKERLGLILSAPASVLESIVAAASTPEVAPSRFLFSFSIVASSPVSFNLTQIIIPVAAGQFALTVLSSTRHLSSSDHRLICRLRLSLQQGQADFTHHSRSLLLLSPWPSRSVLYHVPLIAPSQPAFRRVAPADLDGSTAPASAGLFC